MNEIDEIPIEFLFSSLWIAVNTICLYLFCYRFSWHDFIHTPMFIKIRRIFPILWEYVKYSMKATSNRISYCIILDVLFPLVPESSGFYNPIDNKQIQYKCRWSPSRASTDILLAPFNTLPDYTIVKNTHDRAINSAQPTLLVLTLTERNVIKLCNICRIKILFNH